MTIRRPPPPGAWNSTDPKTRDDLRRMRVWLEQLARDVDALTAVGGGTITEVTSGDASVTVTNGTGPVVDLSVTGGGAVDDVTGSGAINASPTTGNVVVSLDESQLENGGSQELSVAGLNGVLADGQRASALVTTGSDVNVAAAAPPSAGQTLVATDATHATWQSPVSGAPIQAFWWYPASVHSEDREMEENTNAPPTGWTAALFNSGTSAWSTGTNDGNVDLRNNPSSAHYRISCGSQRRSWLQLQGQGTENFCIYRTITAAQSSTLHIKTRMSTNQFFNGSTSSGTNLFFYITGDNGSGRPDLTVTNGIRFGMTIAAGSNDVRWSIFARNGGADKIASVTFPNKAYQSQDFEFIYETAVANGGANRARIWIKSDGDIWQPLEASTGALPFDDSISNRLHNSLTTYLVYRVIQNGSNPAIGNVDYFRRVDAAFNG